MQMTVLPYLVLALIIGFGQLEAGEARRLAVRAGAILLATWVLTLAVIAALPATFPWVQSASFFSSSLVEPPEPFSIRGPLLHLQPLPVPGQRRRARRWFCSAR